MIIIDDDYWIFLFFIARIWEYKLEEGIVVNLNDLYSIVKYYVEIWRLSMLRFAWKNGNGEIFIFILDPTLVLARLDAKTNSYFIILSIPECEISRKWYTSWKYQCGLCFYLKPIKTYNYSHTLVFTDVNVVTLFSLRPRYAIGLFFGYRLSLNVAASFFYG